MKRKTKGFLIAGVFSLSIAIALIRYGQTLTSHLFAIYFIAVAVFCGFCLCIILSDQVRYSNMADNDAFNRPRSPHVSNRRARRIHHPYR